MGRNGKKIRPEISATDSFWWQIFWLNFCSWSDPLRKLTWCLFYCFKALLFCSSKLKDNPKTESSVFPIYSFLCALKCSGSLDAGLKFSKSYTKTCNCSCTLVCHRSQRVQACSLMISILTEQWLWGYFHCQRVRPSRRQEHDFVMFVMSEHWLTQRSLKRSPPCSSSKDAEALCASSHCRIVRN